MQCDANMQCAERKKAQRNLIIIIKLIMISRTINKICVGEGYMFNIYAKWG